MGTPAGFAPTKECFKRSRWFGKRHKTDAFTRLGKDSRFYYHSCMNPTDSAWRAFLMPFPRLLPVSGHLSRGFTVPSTKRAYSALHPQALTECSPLDFRRSSVLVLYKCDYYAALISAFQKCDNLRITVVV